MTNSEGQNVSTLVYRVDSLEKMVTDLKQQLSAFVSAKENELQLTSIKNTVERIEHELQVAKLELKQELSQQKIQLEQMNTRQTQQELEMQKKDAAQREAQDHLQIRFLWSIVSIIASVFVLVAAAYFTHLIH